MSRKNKFDLTHLVHSGYVKDGETVFFVSDPGKVGIVSKQPNGEYKLKSGGETVTVHALAIKFLGQDPPDHASKWFRNKNNKTLYELWQSEHEELAA